MSILKSETSFLENENIKQKLDYRFLVESTIIENVTFPYKTALLKASAKTKKWGARKCTYD